MKLIIAEKPSLARNIAAGIGSMTRGDGFIIGNGYIISWAFGHLFTLYDIEDYTRPNGTGNTYEKVKWTLEGLPCFPEKFNFKLRTGNDGKADDGVKKQFETIKALCLRNDVDTIINAGDSDREGEIIVRLCIDNALYGSETNKAIYRLWLPDQTPQTVKKALEEMKMDSEYDNLAFEGFARTYTDWLYGVNLTRYATIKTGTFLRCGRVIIPIVKAIYDRDMLIKNFTPEKYFAVASRTEQNGGEIELVSKTRFSYDKKKDADALCEKYNNAKTYVTDVKKKKETINPGKLYSLSKLQNVLGRKFKIPMNESLAAAQKLYESGYITYPRTNSEYLAVNEKDRIKTIISQIKGIGYNVEFKDSKNIFDDSKIESHSALTPTYKIPKKSELSSIESTVYTTIFRRFAAVFCAIPCKAEKTEITVKTGEYEEFTLKGTVITEPGWTQYDDFSQKDKLLPALKKGDEIFTDFKPEEKLTSPPKHYTIETLNNYLKNPFREEKAAANDDDNASDDEDYKAMFDGVELGTEATRTGIIENAIKSKYIELKKDVYTILPQGEYLIEAVTNMNIPLDKNKTVKLGMALKKVYRKELETDCCVALAKEEILNVFKRLETEPENDTDTGFYGDIVGICPQCGKNVVRGRYGYGCSGYKDGCKFKISGNICHRVVSASNAKLILKEGKSSKIRGFISKTGKPFDATLTLGENGSVKFDFS